MIHGVDSPPVQTASRKIQVTETGAVSGQSIDEVISDLEGIMARFEMREVELSGLGAHGVPGEDLFQLGINYSTGRGVAADMVAAHKWFNLAAARGNADAARYRRELACEMTPADVAEAQRQAREWISLH
jgi:hypothetical protein